MSFHCLPAFRRSQSDVVAMSKELDMINHFATDRSSFPSLAAQGVTDVVKREVQFTYILKTKPVAKMAPMKTELRLKTVL